MSTLEQPIPTGPARPSAGGDALTRVLLACGVLYALLYVAGHDVLAAGRFPGYDWRSQAVSELSAIGSPARGLELALLPASAVLMVAFGVGVRRCARSRRPLGVAGALLVVFGLAGFLWIPMPMTARADMIAGGAMPATDVGHIALTGVTVLLIVGMIVSAAMSFSTGFRLYSAASVLVVLVFGAANGAQASLLAAGAPTPWIGLAERISIGSWLLWLVVLAGVLLADARPVARPAGGAR